MRARAGGKITWSWSGWVYMQAALMKALEPPPAFVATLSLDLPDASLLHQLPKAPRPIVSDPARASDAAGPCTAADGAAAEAWRQYMQCECARAARQHSSCLCQLHHHLAERGQVRCSSSSTWSSYRK